MPTIYVINPNSSEHVTVGIDQALEPLRMAGGPTFKALTFKEGPPGIQTQRDVDGVIAPLCARVRELDHSAAAFVIACFSDPGLHSVRETTIKPVLGIMESGILTALTLGQKFGVIAILAGSIPRHLRAIGAMGLTDRLAAEVPVGLPVVELVDEAKTFHRMVAAVFMNPSSAEAARVLLMVDQQTDDITALEGALRAAGHTVTKVGPEFSYSLGSTLSNYDVVVHMNGATPDQSMSTTTQQALVQFVRNGGGFIGAQWLGFEESSNGTQVNMPDLVLMGGTFDAYLDGCENCTLSVITGLEGHPC
ncbi:MAG: hypothetical protein EXR39_11555 [Betaproteobacteria bacterium]|nr:hypothetical protein [Betaproteobacteria bacterium]